MNECNCFSVSHFWLFLLPSCPIIQFPALTQAFLPFRYGELQGLNKQETADRYGKEKVHEWRRSYDIPPPNGESLEMCAQRAVAYFKEHVRIIGIISLVFVYRFLFSLSKKTQQTCFNIWSKSIIIFILKNWSTKLILGTTTK